MSEQKNFRQDLLAMIRERYPEGVTKQQAQMVLQALASVAGDILGNATDDGPYHGFMDMVLFAKHAQRGEVPYTHGSLN